MKNLIKIAFCFLLFTNCKSNYYFKNDKYLISIKYLIKKNFINGDDINVVDTLIYVPQILDFDELLINKNSNEYFTKLDSLTKIDNELIFKNVFYNFKEKEFSMFKKGNYNLYFSKPLKNILYLQVINNQNKINLSNKKLSMFNSTVFYRIKFNDLNKIINLKKIEYVSN